MKLNRDQKFILQDDDGNLLLVTEIEFDFNLLQNRVIPMKGIKFDIDYDHNEILEGEEVFIQTSFTIDGISSKEE